MGNLIQTHRVFFVTPEYILQNYSMYLDSNIDVKSIDAAILKAQFQDTQDALGYNLYEKYINIIASGDIFTEPYQYYYLLLNNFIVDEVSCWAITHLLDWSHFRVTNKAIVNKYSQWSNAITEVELNRMKYLVMQDAQHWDSKLREEILNYPNAFPEYFTQIGVYRPPAKTNPYDNFFISGKPRRNRSGPWDQTTSSEWDAGYRCCQ